MYFALCVSFPSRVQKLRDKSYRGGLFIVTTEESVIYYVPPYTFIITKEEFLIRLYIILILSLYFFNMKRLKRSLMGNIHAVNHINEMRGVSFLLRESHQELPPK